MSELTKQRVREIIADINEALKAVAVKHDLKSLACGHAAYNDSNFHVRVEGVARGGVSRDAQRYQASAAELGLPPLGFRFDMARRTYETIGLNRSGTKVLCAGNNGKKYLFPTHFIVLLGQQAATETT